MGRLEKKRMNGIFARMRKKIRSLRYEPIRVFVFHQVSEVFDATTMWECDWTDKTVFQKNISYLRRQYDFVSLEEARRHLEKDFFRRKKYAVLTSDDGWASLKQIVPWLAGERIPLTLFLNPQYLDGIHFQERPTEKLLRGDEVLRLVEEFDPYVSVASHGWEHRNPCKMSLDEFRPSFERSEKVLRDYPHKIGFFAFPFGWGNKEEMQFLRSEGIVPVVVDGGRNYNDAGIIHRECIDGKSLP
jgi:peptidoglycan/xylan/chitin deacetylase (PgdA/CDA1 family)